MDHIATSEVGAFCGLTHVNADPHITVTINPAGRPDATDEYVFRMSVDVARSLDQMLRNAIATARRDTATRTLDRAELLDLLTTAACIGRDTVTTGQANTRGDITAYLLTYPTVRDALPKEA